MRPVKNWLEQRIEAWPDVDSEGVGLTAAKIIQRLDERPNDYEAFRGAVSELCPVSGGKLPSPRSLGNKLGHLRGRVVGGKCVDHRDSHGTKKWFLATITEGDSQEQDA